MVVRRRGAGFEYDFRLLGGRYRKARFRTKAEATAAEKLRRAELLAPDDTLSRLLDEMPGLVPPKTPGVYAILGAGGFVKIGKGVSIAARMRELQCAHPVPLKLLAVLSNDPADERAHHQRWLRLRRSGEWFEPDDELVAHITALRTASGSEELR